MELYYTPACLIRQKKPKLQLIFLQTLRRSATVATEERTKADRGGGAGVPPAADYEAVIVVEGVKQVLSTALPKASQSASFLLQPR